MSECSGLLQREDLQPNSRAKRRELSRAGLLVSLLVIAGWMAGCSAAPAPAKDPNATAIENCFPTSVFTARDMQARVDCHPDDYKLQISKDTVVLFAFPSAMKDWTGPVFVIHVPSVSEAVVDYDGSLFMKDFKTRAGQTAIENVLNDPALMTGILERAREIQTEPTPPLILR